MSDTDEKITIKPSDVRDSETGKTGKTVTARVLAVRLQVFRQ